MGPTLGAEFIAITAGDLAAFGTAARLATYAGLRHCPTIPASAKGCATGPAATTAGCATSSTGPPSRASNRWPSREFYARKRSKRQRHTRAMIALARRLVDVLWALLRDNRTWQPEPPTPLPPLDTIIEIHQGQSQCSRGASLLSVSVSRSKRGRLCPPPAPEHRPCGREPDEPQRCVRSPLR